MRAAEIRERFLSYFEERSHLRVPSASLVPASYDPTVLLTTAGMQPFKPYFRGEEEPPSKRLTSCQKVFRSTDIENVGLTARHLTFFEMLGNFSVGDYFKQGAAEMAWELSTQGFGFAPEKVWISVFGGDEELGLGADDEAIECWRAIGVPDERIVRLGREDNFWQSGPTGPCGPCSELYLDRGPAFGTDEDQPGDDTERYLEFWNLVFMQYELHADSSLTELPQKNIDTGMGLDRMAAVLQDVPSVYETDSFRPLVEFGERRSGRRYGQDAATTRALRVLADHGRAAAFLLADGVVPSNEDRGYILRRILRRAIHQGRSLGIGDPFVVDLCGVVVDSMGDVYPELRSERGNIDRWAASEEEGFSRTLAQGERLLADLVERARADGVATIPAEDAFRLHDTFGFPFEMTQEMRGRAGPRGRRGGLRGAHGGCPGDCAGGRPRHRRGARRRARGALCARRRLHDPLRRIRVHRGGHRGQGGGAPERHPAPKARGQPVLPTGRRPGLRQRRGRDRRGPGAGGGRLPRWQRPGAGPRARTWASPSRASRCARWWSGTCAWRPCATTRPPTCSTLRCASAWATTCARRGRTWGRTSCASTSLTGSG